MKPYHKLECDNLSQIQDQVMDWIRSTNPGLLDSTTLWNKVHTADLVQSTPALVDYCKSMGLIIREVALTIINKQQDEELHIDELPITAKINIPILNTQNSYNRWYKVSEELLANTQPEINLFGKKYYTFTNVDYSKLKLLGELELIHPVVFDSQIAHNIVIEKECTFPRIVLSCTFFKEPLRYLED